MSLAIKSILVVDDVVESCDLLALRLVKMGYTVAKAKDGQEALAVLQHNQIDLVFLDINMPIMNGVDTLKAIRADEMSAKLAVIMLTSEDSAKSVMKCMQLGANDYITKPFSTKSIQNAIGNLKA